MKTIQDGENWMEKAEKITHSEVMIVDAKEFEKGLSENKSAEEKKVDSPEIHIKQSQKSKKSSKSSKKLDKNSKEFRQSLKRSEAKKAFEDINYQQQTDHEGEKKSKRKSAKKV